MTAPSTLPVHFYSDFLAHRSAFRSQRFFLPSKGTRQGRWKVAQAWSRWYSLTKGLAPQVDAVGTVKDAAAQVLSPSCGEFYTWAEYAPSPEATWHHPLAEAFVRLNDGNGVAESWLVSLLEAAQEYPPGQPWATFVGPESSYPVPIEALAILAVLGCTAVRPDLSTYELTGGADLKADPWGWSREVAQRVPELERCSRLWARNPDVALDAVLMYDFAESSWAIQAALMTFLCDAGACPSPPALECFRSTLEGLSPFHPSIGVFRLLEKTLHACQMDGRLPPPTPGSAHHKARL